MFNALLLALLIHQKLAPPRLIGADKVIRSLQSPTLPTTSPANAAMKLIDERRNFVAQSPKMSVQEAANGWLKLVLDWLATSHDPGMFEQSANIPDLSNSFVIAALPRPEAWPAIKAGILKRSEEREVADLLLVMDLLLGDDDAVIKGCENLRKPTPAEGPEWDFEGQSLSKVELPLAIRTGKLDLVHRILTLGAQSHSFFFFDGPPDIVGLFGVDKARPILTSMLEAAKQPIERFNGLETRRLALSILIADEKVKTPQWSLVDRSVPVETVTKLVERFGVRSLAEQNGITSALSLYIGHLVKEGNISQAVTVLESDQTPQYWNSSESGLGKTQLSALYVAVGADFENKPSKEVCTAYTDLARQLGDLSQARNRLAAATRRTELSDKIRRTLLADLGKLDAELGDANSAVSDYVMAANLPLDPNDNDQVTSGLIQLAVLTGHFEALDVEAKGPQDSYGSAGPLSVYLEANRLVDAQKYVLAKATRPPSENRGAGPTAETPLQLAQIYFDANRPQDLMDLIDSYPNWAGNDLFDILGQSPGGGYREGPHQRHMGFLAAWAFAKTGRKELAIKTLHDLLFIEMANDDAYQLLNDTEGSPALPFYERLAKIDPYAPRPVMWKADLLRRLNRLDEAERVARAAVTMDPTDGDAGPGHRLMSYAILAQILRAKHDPKAELYETIVKAVRIAEKADTFRDAGLLPQALKLYQESSSTFANAYCVQARIALTLVQQGKTEDALEHYKRAFELMPGSFGEVESFCFGCQGVFQGEPQRNIALDAFEKLARALPDKPQVRYLLGLLHAQQGETKEALASFKEAVRLDPRYLNAWLQIQDLGKLGGLTAAELDHVTLVILHLDPYGLHGRYGNIGSAKNYADIWRAYSEAYASLPALPSGPLYPLKKSKQLGDGMSAVYNDRGRLYSELSYGPGGGLLSIPLVQDILRIRVNN